MTPPPRIPLANAIPQIAAAAPLAAFAFVGTTVPISDGVEHALQVASLPVLVGVLAAVCAGTRRARAAAGAVLVVWWMVLAIALVFIAGGVVSWFGLATFGCTVPVLIAFTFGKAWGIHDLKDRGWD